MNNGAPTPIREDLHPATLGVEAVNAGVAASQAALDSGTLALGDTLMLPAVGPKLPIALSRHVLIEVSPEADVVTEAQTITGADIALSALRGHGHDSSFNSSDTVWQAQRREAEKIAIVRERIGGLSSSQAARLDQYLDSTAPAEYLPMVDAVPLQGQEEGRWKQWLAGSSATDLKKFLRWHVETLAAQQMSGEVQSTIAAEKAKFMGYYIRGLNEKWLVGSQGEMVQKIDRLKIYLGDAFDTLVDDVWGYRMPGSDVVVFAAGAGRTTAARAADASNKMRQTSQHELAHPLLGDMSADWRTEAAIDHTSLAMEFGHVSIIDPATRNGRGIDRRRYVPRRALLAYELTGGSITIDPAYITRALSGGEAEKAAYRNMLGKSWGTPFAEEYTNFRVNALEEKYRSQGMVRDEAEQAAARDALHFMKTDPRAFFGLDR